MANSENIKPYAQLAHEASLKGGPEKFLKDHAEANFKLGVESEKDTEGWKVLLVTGAAIGLWELGKLGINTIKNVRIKKKEDLVAKSKEAEKNYQNSIKEEFIHEGMENLE